MTDLERAAEALIAAGWTVERPPFDDPYEVAFRRLLAVVYGTEGGHSDDDPTSRGYEWQECEAAGLVFLKKHFVLKGEAT